MPTVEAAVWQYQTINLEGKGKVGGGEIQTDLKFLTMGSDTDSLSEIVFIYASFF